MKKVLIVNYGFPPNSGIGGRRWALFADQLTQKGYSVHVLSKKENNSGQSLYSNILNNKNITTHKLPTFYPKVLNIIPQTLKEKILYKFWNTLLTFYSKGSPYDKTIFFRKKIQRKAIYLIKNNNIKNIIVTGAPFRLCYYFAEIKHEIPNLIIDFRDPWTWGEGYGYKNLNKNKFLFEQKMQDLVLKNSNVIFSPVEIMTSKLSKLYPNFNNKIMTLPHAFAKNSITQHDGNRFKQSKPIKLIFIGSLYNGIEQYFKELIKVLEVEPDNYTLDIYSSSKRYKQLFENSKIAKLKVNYFKQLTPDILYSKIGSYDFCLMIHPSYGKDNISTKFYEIIYSKTPIIYFGEPGITKSFITRNKLGIALSIDSIFKSLSEYIYNYNYEPCFDIENYTYDRVTQQLLTFFK